jgi:hypothetical protein
MLGLKAFFLLFLLFLYVTWVKPISCGRSARLQDKFHVITPCPGYTQWNINNKYKEDKWDRVLRHPALVWSSRIGFNQKCSQTFRCSSQGSNSDLFLRIWRHFTKCANSSETCSALFCHLTGLGWCVLVKLLLPQHFSRCIIFVTYWAFLMTTTF